MSYDIQYFSFSSIGIHSWRRRQQRRRACFPISWLKFLNKWHWAEICADLTIQKPSPTCIIQIGFDKRMRISSNFNRKDMLNCNAKVFGSQWVEEKERGFSFVMAFSLAFKTTAWRSSRPTNGNEKYSFYQTSNRTRKLNMNNRSRAILTHRLNRMRASKDEYTKRAWTMDNEDESTKRMQHSNERTNGILSVILHT